MSKIFAQAFENIILEIYDDKPKDLNLFEVNQTHSSKIIDLKPEDISVQTEADGIIADLNFLSIHKMALAIKTADCLPITYIGKSSVALVHAGWRGVQQKIHLSKKLKEINPHTIFIGPCISEENFEVQADFIPQFAKSTHFSKKNDQIFFNLLAHTKEELQNFFPVSKIISTNICTFKNNQYNSFRRNQTRKRNWNILKIKR